MCVCVSHNVLPELVSRISDLERQISMRTSREDLIKRGLLKEIDENGQPIIPKEAPIAEDEQEDNLCHDQG